MTETTAIQEYSKTDAALADLSQRFRSVVFDVSTTKGLSDATQSRAEIRGYRTSLEKTRKEIKEPALERCRLIDAEAKRITAALVELEEPIDEQIKKEEARKEAIKAAEAEKEASRIRFIQDRIASIVAVPGSVAGRTSDEIQIQLNVMDDEPPPTWAEEFTPIATDALARAKETLTLMVSGAKAQEEAKRADDERIRAEREELARLREEARLRDEQERVDRQAREVEEQRQKVIRDAEAAKIRDQQAAEAKRLENQRKEQERLQKELDARLKEATKPATLVKVMDLSGRDPETIAAVSLPVEVPRNVNTGMSPEPSMEKFDLRARIDDVLDTMSVNDLMLVLNYVQSL